MTTQTSPRTLSLPDWASAPDGHLQSRSIGALPLEAGGRLDDITLAFQRWGRPTPELDNVVLVLHALTGDSHATGTTGPSHPTAGWWDGLIGPGAAIDTDQWCAVSINVLGGCSGSTGPGSLAADGLPYGSRFPIITVRDQVDAEAALLRELGVTRLAAVAGGSMGGARALEWIIGHPEKVRAALVLAVGARATADQIGTQSTQLAAIRADPNWRGGNYHGTGVAPTAGLGVARRIAHLSYRTADDLDDRFRNDAQRGEHPLTGERYAIQSYLDHQADKLVRRFDAGSYVVLTEVLNHHDVGRGRGGVEAALASCPVPVVVGGITSDRLYPLSQQAELAAALPGCVDGLQVIDTDAGHDGFLTQFAPIAAMLRRMLELADREV